MNALKDGRYDAVTRAKLAVFRVVQRLCREDFGLFGVSRSLLRQFRHPPPNVLDTDSATAWLREHERLWGEERWD